MAISVNGYNTSRLSGMFSGLDTESLVSNMLASDQAKIDKIFQQKEKAQWKYDAYTELNNSVSSLRNNYLSVLGQNSLMKSSAYNSFKVSVSDNSAVRVTSTASAQPTNFRILSATKATAAGKTSIVNSSYTQVKSAANLFSQAEVTKEVPGISAETTIDDLADELGLADGEALSFSINGEVFTLDRTITETDAEGTETTRAATLGDLADMVNQRTEDLNVEMTIGDGTVTIRDKNIGADSKLEFGNITGQLFTDDNGAGVLGAGNGDVKKTINTNVTFSDLGGKQLGADSYITINGEQFAIYNGDTEKTVGQLMQEINDKTAETGVTMEVDDNTGALIFRNTEAGKNSKGEAIGGTKAIELEGDIFGADSATGINAGRYSEIGSISRGDTIYEATRKLGNAVDGEVKITINNQEFTFNARTTTLSDMMEEINGNADAKAVFNYSELTDSFQISSAETGANSTLSFDFGELGEAFGLTLGEGEVLRGTDATLKVNSNGIERTVSQASNTFTLDGMTFEITGDHAEEDGAISVSLERDYQPTIDAIKGFIEDYNKLIGELNGKYYESVYRDYQPLTDEQRSAITEDEAKLWDEKAKSGILRNDSAIGNLLSNLRTALYEKVGDTGMSAFDLGITTVGWSDSWRTDQGKLQLDEDKLLAALQENPSAVQDVFTHIADDSETGGAKENSGLLVRMNSFMSSFNTTMRSQNIQLTQNSINSYSERMNELLDKMSEKEERYWLQFSQLETLMSEMQSQQNWLASQLGLSTTA